MFKVGDKVKLNSYYSAVKLSKGTTGIITKTKDRNYFDPKIVKQLVWVKFRGLNKVAGCFDYRLDSINKQLEFSFMDK